MTDYEPVPLYEVTVLYKETPTSVHWASDAAITEAATYVPALVREVMSLRTVANEPNRPPREEVDEHAPWSYTEFGVLCACGSAMDGDENCLATKAKRRDMPAIFAKKLRKARRQRDAAKPVIEAARRLAAGGEHGWHAPEFRAAVHATIAAVVAYERGET